jgi:hypothetical protein
VRTRIFLSLLLFILSAGAWAAPFSGPFTLSDGISFYLVNPTGADFDLTVSHHNAARERRPQPALVRVFDPRDTLVARHEFPGDIVIPAPTEQQDFRIEGGGQGVYSVIITGGGQVQIATEPELEFGVYGHFQWLTGNDEQYADAYVYLPPGLKQLPIIADQGFESLTLADEAGQQMLQLEKGDQNRTVDLPAEGEHVWHMSARGSGSYRLDFKGYPIIVCPSAQTARAIHAGVDIMADGTICYHKHQVAAWELLQQYRKRPAEDFAVELVPIEDYTDLLLAEPGRNQLLFNYYGVISNLAPILASQNLDPDSPWFGSIHVWEDAQRNPRENDPATGATGAADAGDAGDAGDAVGAGVVGGAGAAGAVSAGVGAGNPLADYNRFDMEAFAALNKIMAALYWMDEPFNPYYRSPQLLNRIIIGALLDQMMIKKDERVIADNIYYYGIHAFSLCHSHSGAFSLVYDDVPPEVQQVWLAGQQRVTDRYLSGTVGGCVNQWTVLLQGMWRYCQAMEQDTVRREAVLRNLGWLMSDVMDDHGQRAAGYMTESSGPDATYNGITCHNMAYMYNTSGWSEIRESLRRAYELFNHTIASEPDGTWLGSSGYCHRTPGDWTSPQYGAGLGPMLRHLPEAGVRMPDHSIWAFTAPIYDEASRQAAQEQLRKSIRYFDDDHLSHESANYARALGAFDIMFANWQTYSDQWLEGVLPCNSPDSFTRDFGDEFFVVKRPAYYAFLYGAVTYGAWTAPRRPTDHMDQYPHNDGLCMFWSPQFGVSLLSKNWGASRANTLLAELGEGKTEWPWYWDTEHQFDVDGASATLSGRVHQTPLSYQRVYRFLDDRIECELTVTADEAVELQRLSECIPYPAPDQKPGGLEAVLLDAAGQRLDNGAQARAVYFTNDSGQGHLLTLTEPRSVNLGSEHSVDHYGGEHDWCRALLALPTQWAAGQSVTVAYSLQPCAAEQVTEALQ